MFRSHDAPGDHRSRGGFEDGDLYRRSLGAEDQDEERRHQGGTKEKLVEKPQSKGPDLVPHLPYSQLETHR